MQGFLQGLWTIVLFTAQWEHSNKGTRKKTCALNKAGINEGHLTLLV